MKHGLCEFIIVQSSFLWANGAAFQVTSRSEVGRFNNFHKVENVRKRVVSFEKSNESKGVDIDGVAKEVNEALEAARKALEAGEAVTTNKPPEISKSVKDAAPWSPPPPPPPPAFKAAKAPPAPQPPKLDPIAQKKMAEIQGQALAATVGGAVFGGTLGAGLLLATDLPNTLGLDGESALALPVATAVFLSGTATATALQDSIVGQVSRAVFAQPVLGFSESVVGNFKKSLRNVYQWFVGIPDRLANAAKKKAQETADNIVSFPGRAVTKVKEEITAIPEKVIEAAESTAKKVETDIKAIPSKVAAAAERTADAAVSEIKATPGRVADAATKSAQIAGQVVEEAVEDLLAIPGKAVKAVGEKVEVVVEDIAAFPKDIASKIKGNVEEETPKALSQSQPKPPRPPSASETVGFPAVSLPKMELPKVEPVKFPDLRIRKEVEAPRIRAAPKGASVQDREKAVRLNAQLKKEKELREKSRAAELKMKAEQEEKQAAAAKAEAEAKRQAAAAAQKEAAEKRKANMEATAQAAAKRAEAAAQLALKEKERREALADAAANKNKAAKQRQEAQAAREAAAEKQRQAEQARAAREAAERRRNAEEARAASVKKDVPSKPTKRPVATRAPRGVPTIVKWRQRRDGGITGIIYGSPNFDEGERVETSPIESGSIANGSVVKTGSGSRYFLSDTAPAAPVPDKSAMKTLLAAIPGATITLTKAAREREAKKAQEALEQAPQTSRTFSLFGLGGGGQQKEATVKKETVPVKPVRKAPAGIPTITKWRKNRDGSVTGLIFGSRSFGEGERVTTSPISSGNVVSGEVVRTGSGSKYFLD